MGFYECMCDLEDLQLDRQTDRQHLPLANMLLELDLLPKMCTLASTCIACRLPLGLQSSEKLSNPEPQKLVSACAMHDKS